MLLTSILTILLHPHFPRRSDNSTSHLNMDLRNARFISIFYGWKNLATKFEKQITTTIQRCYFAVETRVVFTTRPLLPQPRRMYYLPTTTIMLFINLCTTAIWHNIHVLAIFLKPSGNHNVLATFWETIR